MDLRPQAHEIIRTWLFSTVVRSHLEHDRLPWRDAAISGWILDPDRKKMSKSKGNVVTPTDLLEEYGSDAVRYWAASGRPGTDTAFDEGQMKIGRRLAIKILNAQQVRARPRRRRIGGGRAADVSEPLGPRPCWPALAQVVREATAAFEDYNYTRALEVTETVLLVVLRRLRRAGQGPCLRHSRRAGRRVRADHAGSRAVGAASAVRAVPAVRDRGGLVVVAGGLGAPRRPGRSADEVSALAQDGDPQVVADVAGVLATIRKAKSDAKVGMRADIASAQIALPAANAARVALAADDLAAAGRIADLRFVEGEAAPVIELAEAKPA